jgi:DNA (cytosine-5)-methyltransferase 1
MLTCVDSFCGAGGLSLGLRQAGLDVVYAFDHDEMAVKTYEANIGPHVERRSAETITADEILSTAGVDHVDVFAGGPPCQGFSKQKRGAHNGDPRNELVLQYARLVSELRPSVFLLENVTMFGHKRGKRFVDDIRKLLRDYRLIPHFYNSADYGLAQTRRRFIIVGQMKGLAGRFLVPEPTVDRWRTVGEVLRGLPEPPHDYGNHPDYPNHQRARVTARNIERFSHVPQGGGWRDIPEELRLACHRNVDTSRGGWPDVYGRLEEEGQAPTLTGGFDSFTRGRYGHPWQDRPLTPREAARLQGFPDWFVFHGTRQDIRTQIGNAVPPPLATTIGKAVLLALMANGEPVSLGAITRQQRQQLQLAV